MLPIIGEPFGPGGRGYFEVGLLEYNPAANSNSTAPPIAAMIQLFSPLRRVPENEFILAKVGTRELRNVIWNFAREVLELQVYLQWIRLGSSLY